MSARPERQSPRWHGDSAGQTGKGTYAAQSTRTRPQARGQLLQAVALGAQATRADQYGAWQQARRLRHQANLLRRRAGAAADAGRCA